MIKKIVMKRVLTTGILFISCFLLKPFAAVAQSEDVISVTPQGNVLIGGGSPLSREKLTVAGDMRVSGMILDKNYQAVPPVGTVMLFAGSAPPVGWFLCDGGTRSTSEFQNLYSIIHTMYGPQTAMGFKLPDLRAAAPKSGTTSLIYIIKY